MAKLQGGKTVPLLCNSSPLLLWSSCRFIGHCAITIHDLGVVWECLHQMAWRVRLRQVETTINTLSLEWNQITVYQQHTLALVIIRLHQNSKFYADWYCNLFHVVFKICLINWRKNCKEMVMCKTFHKMLQCPYPDEESDVDHGWQVIQKWQVKGHVKHFSTESNMSWNQEKSKSY